MAWQIGRFPCAIPLGHDLPFIWQNHPLYSTAVARIAAFLAESRADFCAIDIGANIGDSALLIRNAVDCPILCAEADPLYFRLLEQNTADLPRVSRVRALLAAESRTLHGCLERVSGSSRFRQNPSGPSGETVTLDSVLEGHPAFQHAQLLKTDTDGFDFEVLRGAETLLRRASPVLHFEFDPTLLAGAGSDPWALMPFLQDLGYGPALAYDHTGPLRASLQIAKDNLREMFGAWSHGNPSFYLDLTVFPSVMASHAQEFFAREQAVLRSPPSAV